MLLQLSMLIGMIALSGLITSGYPTPVSGRLGSDLLLPVEDACRTNGSYLFDLYSKKVMIGTYHDGFQGLRGYNGRLTYDLKTCTVKLSNLTEGDGTEFYVYFLHGIDGKSGQHYISYIIIMNNDDSRTTDPPHVTASEPTSHNESQVPPRRHHSSVSFYFSLDSVVNAIFPFVVLIRKLKKSCEMLEENRANFACQIIRCFAVLFQVISVVLVSNGSPYSWFLILIPTILSVDVLLYFVKNAQCYSKIEQSSSPPNNVANCTERLGCLPGCVGAHITIFMDKFLCACCNEDKNSIWSVFILLLQVVFPFCVGIIWYKTDNDNSRRESFNIGYVFLAVVISLVLNTGVFFITYCCKTKRNGFTQAPSKETGNAPDNHV